MRVGIRVSLWMLFLTLIAERFSGIYDPVDLYAAMAGTLIGLTVCFLRVMAVRDCPVVPVSRRRTGTTAVAGTVLAAAFISGSYCVHCGDGYFEPSAKPVYLSYGELRSAVAVAPARELDSIKRVYLYEDFIFLNRRNEGIHVIDNSDPANPDNVAFINIPGNTEIAIRDNYLYADSYVDLVTLNLNDPQNIFEENRQIDIFPWDEYQNVPDNIWFEYGSIDQNRGVVVGYQSNE